MTSALIRACSVCLIALLSGLWLVSAGAGEADPARELRGKVTTGYQGWFTTPDDGFGLGFRHYAGPSGDFEPGNTVIDMWPDVSGLPDSSRTDTPFRKADGSVAQVYSSADPAVTDTHFRWMKEYGIDAAFLQRFVVSVTKEDGRVFRDQVLRNVASASAAHGRKWSLMYDLSGRVGDTVAEDFIRDFKHVVDTSRDEPTGDFRHRDNYLTVNGRPLVAVWGVGFSDGRSYTLDDCIAIVEFLKQDPDYGDNAVMLGVPYHWRMSHRDATDDPRLHELLAHVEVISPWSVGRYRTPEQAYERVDTHLRPDQLWGRERGVMVLPVIYPGFSWHNMQIARGKRGGKHAAADAFDSTPRRGGALFWAGGMAAHEAGAEAIYLAMFDEVDEATALLPIDPDPPVGESPFLTLNPNRPDHYLWLAGEMRRVWRGEREPARTLPER